MYHIYTRRMWSLDVVREKMYAQRLAVANARHFVLSLTSTSASRNQRELLLLLLPAEIRNRVYYYALENKTYSAMPTLQTPAPNPNSLLLACRQVYYEASVLP
jgi:hypothetical protein